MWVRFNANTQRGFPLVGQRRYCSNDGVAPENQKYWLVWLVFEGAGWRIRFEMDDQGFSDRNRGQSILDAWLGTPPQGWMFLLAYRIGGKLSMAINGSIAIEREFSATANLVNLSDRFSIGGWTAHCPNSALQFPPMGTDLGDVRVYIGDLPRCVAASTTAATTTTTSTFLTAIGATISSAIAATTTATAGLSSSTTTNMVANFPTSTDNTPLIAGVVVGSLLFLAVVGVVIFVVLKRLKRRRHGSQEQELRQPPASEPQPQYGQISIIPAPGEYDQGRLSPATSSGEYIVGRLH
jgi:hypothetical protein